MARPTTRTSVPTVVGLCLVLAACGRSDATAPSSLSRTSPRPEGGEPGPATVLAAAEPRAATATLAQPEATANSRSVAHSTSELLRVTVQCTQPATGPLELYVLDPDAILGAHHDALQHQPWISTAWPTIDEPATRLEIDGTQFDGDTTYEIERPGRRATIVARMGELAGRNAVRLAQEGVLILPLDTTLPVERSVVVRDARGIPVSGARVGAASRDELDAARFSSLARHARVTTDARGTATVLQRAPDHVAFALLPLLGVVPADEHDPLRVTLPETTTLVVTTRPNTAEGKVTLRVPSPLPQSPEHVVGELQGTTRTLRCAQLPLGIRLQVRLEGRDGAVAEQWVTTPERPGEELAVVLDVLQVATLMLQLVDEARAPLPGIRVEVAPFSEGRGPSTSDDAGRVVLELDPTEDYPRSLEDVHVVEVAPAEARRRGRTSIFVDALVGAIDGSVVVMHGPRVVVAGRVVNTRGEPIVAATLELLGDRRLPSRVLGIGGGGRPPFDPPPLPGVRVMTGPDGTFELRTAEEFGEGKERLRLRAHARGHAATRPISFDEGVTDLVVTLGAPGSITVDTSSIPRDTAGQLTLELYDATGMLLAENDLRPSLDFRQLCRGTYSLGLHLGGVELERLDGFVVPEGSACADPRLAPLKLRAPIGARTYDLALPGGAVVDEARLHYWLGDGVAQLDCTLEPGRVSVVASVAIRRTVVEVPKHIAVDVTDLPNGARVELAPELEVELSFACDRALPERLRIWVEREGCDLPATHLGSWRRLDDDGKTTVLLPGPGRYVAELDSTDLSLADPTFEVRGDTRRVELVVR